MSVTRSCASCGRPNGPKFASCMYCGGELPAVGEGAPAGEVDPEEKAQRARELLESLTPKARSMMPPSVLMKLEAEASYGREPEPGPPTTRPTGPRLVYSAPEVDEGQNAPVARPSGPVDRPSHSIADLPPANQERGRGSFEATMLEALGRGGGPFGPRKAPWRLMLLPSPAYREGLPWLRSRLARTVGVDLYTASQHLQRSIATCLAVADEAAELEALLGALRDASLEVAILQRREWVRGRLPRIVDEILHLDEDPLLFILEDGEPLAVPRRTLHSALLAEISPVREALRIERNRWGVPKKTERASLDDRFTPYLALDLLLHDDPRSLRIRSSALDFAQLFGPDVQIAATLNMRHLVKVLSPADRELALDVDFRKVQVLPGPQEREQAGGMKPGTVPRRAVDFTEYGLLRALALHPL